MIHPDPKISRDVKEMADKLKEGKIYVVVCPVCDGEGCFYCDGTGKKEFRFRPSFLKNWKVLEVRHEES